MPHLHASNLSPTAPPRGFPTAEFEARLARAQRLMARQRIAAMLLTTEPEVRYFSGFLTQLWQSPTRPWFLIVPAAGQPVAVIPEIGAGSMGKTWIETIHTWPSPAPADEGISLLMSVLRDTAGATGRIGVPMGPETHLRMPLADFDRLRDNLPGAEWVDATPLIRALRMIKSEAEIAKIGHICTVASASFQALPGWLSVGTTEIELFRAFRLDLLRRGADDVPYLVGGARTGGYNDIISPPSARPLQPGDLLILDTGAVFDGYYCDFDRNFVIGPPVDAVRQAHDILYRATEAGLRTARPGAAAADLFYAMARVLKTAGEPGSGVGRLGHGLGMQLTEWPSLTEHDQTVLAPGMVLTLEPGLMFAPGKMMVHEEDIVIREDGAVLLSQRAPAELPVIA